MARKKNSKRAKLADKSPANASLIKKMEKTLTQTPLKLAKLINKEVSSLKKKQNKLKSTIDKINQQIKKHEKRLVTAAKIDSAAGKKQAKAAQQKLNAALKIQRNLEQQWEQTSLPLDKAANMQSKFVALNKHLESFEKEWAKQAKTALKTKSSKKSRPESAIIADSAGQETYEPIEEHITEHMHRDVESESIS
jgi:hypothetical protein